jgi:hypothetical protein
MAADIISRDVTVVATNWVLVDPQSRTWHAVQHRYPLGPLDNADRMHMMWQIGVHKHCTHFQWRALLVQDEARLPLCTI